MHEVLVPVEKFPVRTGKCLVKAVLGEYRICMVEKRLHVVRIDRECSVAARQGIVEAVQGQQRRAPIGEHVGIIRLDGKGFLVAREGIVFAAERL